MNQEHNDLRAIHDKLEAIHKRLREMLEAEGAILSSVTATDGIFKALLAGQAKTNDLLASIAETLKSIDTKTPDPVDIETDGGAIALKEGPKS